MGRPMKGARMLEMLRRLGVTVNQREKGKTHKMAIRALAYKWTRILWRCWQDRKPYDEDKYLMALKAQGLPLVKELAS